MKTIFTTLVGHRKKVGVGVAALLTAAAIGGWALSTRFATIAAAVESASASEMMRKNDTGNQPIEESKRRLVGSYVVTGTDSDGKPYVGTHMLDISLAPSGAIEVDWDNGKNVGVGQVTGNVLAVASWTRGRTAILMMNINPDGLSGKSLRRTDRGSKGSETWKKL